MMNPPISFVTLGVRDLEKMTDFYQNILGWATETPQEGVTFFKMNTGLIFALFGEKDLAEDIGLGDSGWSDQNSYKNLTLALNFDSVAAVDAYVEQLIQKGVCIQKMPETVFWGGYRGYFADPEDNYWEIAYNPFMTVPVVAPKN